VGAVLVIVNSLARDYAVAVEHLFQLNDRARASGKVVAVSYFSPADPLPRERETELKDNGVIILPDPVRAVRALGALKAALRIRTGVLVAAAPSDGGVSNSEAMTGPRVGVTGTASRSSLGGGDLGSLLGSYGVAAAIPRAAASAAHAADLLEETGAPGVVKLDDPGIAHKTEAGAIRMDIATRAQACQAYDELVALATSADRRVVVQRQVNGGIEVIVGCLVDPEFGRIVTIGAGGIFTELFKDVGSALCPLEAQAARDLLARTRMYPLLTGFRHGRRFDITALTDLIIRVSRLFAERLELVELELNPVLVLPEGQGALVVDVLGVRLPTL